MPRALGNDSRLPLSTWEKPNGRWTLASTIVDHLGGLSAAERYFIYISLDRDRFRGNCDNDAFYEQAGLPLHAAGAVHPERDGAASVMGDYAWAAGDLAAARCRYEESIAKGDSSGIVGAGGLVRLSFFEGRFHGCIEVFRRTCPPHQYYLDHQIMETRTDIPSNDLLDALIGLSKRFPGTAPCFISRAKYMQGVIVAAAVLARALDASLHEMICDYFGLASEEVSTLVAKVTDNEKELARLKRAVVPKVKASGGTLDDLFRAGDTPRARTLVDRVPKVDQYVESAGLALDAFLNSGNMTCLDKMIAAGSPFGIPGLDGIVLATALESREATIASLPGRRLILLRRLGRMERHPAGYVYPPNSCFFDAFIETMHCVDGSIQPDDILSCILSIPWSKTRYQIDNPFIDRNAFAFALIKEHWEWLELVLLTYPKVLKRHILVSRDKAIDAIYGAYLFLRKRFNDVRLRQKWFHEAQLIDAIEILFGKHEVECHAHPIWLGRQHLDVFLPRYRLAIEYMGIHHYRGGAFGPTHLAEGERRDENKRRLCEAHGVQLEYVTYRENVGRRAREIFERFAKRSSIPVAPRPGQH